MKFSTRLREVLKEKGITQTELSKRTGISKSVISEWLSDKYEPKQDKVYIIAEKISVSPSWLFGVSNEKEVKSDLMSIYNQLAPPRQQKVYQFTEYQLSEQQKVVNLKDYITETLRGYVSAGTGEYQTEEINEEVQLPKSIIPEQKYDLVLQVNGNSMTPMFKDKEYIFVRTDSEYRSGQIGVFIIDGESYLKKAYIENDQIRLVSLNDEYPDQIFKDFNDVKLVGTVVM